MFSKISVVIPVYNEADAIANLLLHLSRCDAVQQLHSIVVVDGNSNDGTIEKANEFKSNLKNLVVLSNYARITPISLNIGTEYAIKNGAELIQYFGAHSEISPNFFTELEKLATSRNDVDIFNSSMNLVEPKRSIEQVIQNFTLSRLGRNWKKFTNISEPVNGFCTGIFAARKAVFENIGFYNPKFIRNQDNDFVARALEAKLKATTFPELVYYYKTRDSLLSHLSQMYGSGVYISLDPKHYNWKHKVPGYFYLCLVSYITVLLLLNILINPEQVAFLSYLFVAGIMLYILIPVIEGFMWQGRFHQKMFVFPFLVLASHFVYAIGHFKGFLKVKIKKSIIK